MELLVTPSGHHVVPAPRHGSASAIAVIDSTTLGKVCDVELPELAKTYARSVSYE